MRASTAFVFLGLLLAATCTMAAEQNIPANIDTRDTGATKMAEAKDRAAKLRNLLDTTENHLKTLTKNMNQMEKDLDWCWILAGIPVIFLMIIGWTFVEAGKVRSVNVTNVLHKNLILTALVGIMWWIVGYGFSFATNHSNGTMNAFIGNGKVFLASDLVAFDQPEYLLWTYFLLYAILSTFVATSGLAERTKLWGYIIYAICYSGFLFPVVVHWVWAYNGWLSAYNPEDTFGQNGMIDFSGSGVVFLMGAFSALAGTLVLRERTLRFDEKFAASFPQRFEGQYKVYSGLGVMLMWAGFYGFNCVMMLRMSGAKSLLCLKIAVNTTLAGGAGGIFGALADLLLSPRNAEGHRVLNLHNALHGCLCALISICAGCSVVEPWAAFVIGAFSAVFFILFKKLLAYLRIDDPIDSIAFAGAGGIHGLFAVGWFARWENTQMAYGRDTKYGIWYGGDAGQWGCQLFGMGTIAAWALVTGLPIFFILNALGLLRHPTQVELDGLDPHESGEMELKEQPADSQ